MNDTPQGDRVEPRPPDGNGPRYAEEKRSRWVGWIWAVPIAAVAIVGYLGIEALTSSGPDVMVTFPGAPDVKAGNTKVQFQGQEVGTVESVKLEKDLEYTDVHMSLKPELADHLGPSTRFWLQGGSLSLNDLGDIKTILSGPFIGMDPQPGKETHKFVGLPEKPVLEGEPAGHSYVLHAPQLGTVSRGSNVMNRGVQVGSVLRTSMAKDGRGVTLQVFIKAPYDRMVHEGTRFWDASAIDVSAGATGPRVQFQSLPALVSGAIAFETPPEAQSRPEALEGAQFQLYPGKSAAENVPSSQALPYRVVFDDPSSTLPAGAPVMLAGQRIGSVEGSALAYDAETQRLKLTAKLMLEPAGMKIGHGNSDARAQMDMMLRVLVNQGLRAGIQSSPPVIGGEQVALRFVKGAQQASLGSGQVPEIPTTEGGGSFQGIMAQASDTLARVNAMKLDQIGENLEETTQRIAALAQSTQTRQSLDNLSTALTNVKDASSTLKREIGPTLTDLREAVNRLQAVVSQANETSGVPGTATLPTTLYELRRAAQSIRELAGSIEQHPAELLRGR